MSKYKPSHYPGGLGRRAIFPFLLLLVSLFVAACTTPPAARARGIDGNAGELGGAPLRERNKERSFLSRDNLLALAKKYIGIPYRFGGASPNGFDCSGYTSYVYGKAGLKIPHGAAPQHKLLKHVKSPQPGDLVFFRTYTPNVSHVGIFVGGKQFLHSPRTGRTVSYADISSSYWRSRFAGAGTPYATGSGKSEPAPKTEPPPKKEPEPKKGMNQELLDFEMLQAIYVGDEAAFTKFLEMGARPGAVYKDWSALMLAAYHNRPGMARLLVKSKADVNYRAPRGWTALSVAKERGHTEIEQLLFAAGAVRTRAIGRPPLMPDPAKEEF